MFDVVNQYVYERNNFGDFVGGFVLYVTPVAKRNVIPIERGRGGKDHIAVTGQAKDAITRIAQTYGMKEIAIVSRIYLWFVDQPDIVQKSVLGMLPAGFETEVLRAALDRAEKKGKR